MLLIITAAAVLAGAPTDLRPAQDVDFRPAAHVRAGPVARPRPTNRRRRRSARLAKPAHPLPAKVAAVRAPPVVAGPTVAAIGPPVAPPVAPVAAPAPMPAPEGTAPASLSPPPPSGREDTAEIPPGAPDDDYGLVAWCQGALTGHMALYPLVKPQLDEMERKGAASRADDARIDDEQMQAGRDYLALYAHARDVAEQSGASQQKPRGEAARAEGEQIWRAARLADPTTRMWSWVMWELPARCETAARRLESNQGVSGEVVRRHSSDDAGAVRPN